MNMPTLDETTKKIINNIPIGVLREDDRYYSLHGDIVYYGVNAVATIFLMNKARGIHSGAIQLEEFTQKYQLDFSNTEELKNLRSNSKEIEEFARKQGKDPEVYYTPNGFSMPLRNIENESIFIPSYRYLDQKFRIEQKKRFGKITYKAVYDITQNPNVEIRIFDADLFNRIEFENKDELKLFEETVRRAWVAEDLKNTELVSKGAELGNILFNRSINNYYSYLKEKHPSKEIMRASENLIQYYVDVVKQLNSEK